jgi:hypothetical protein
MDTAPAIMAQINRTVTQSADTRGTDNSVISLEHRV